MTKKKSIISNKKLLKNVAIVAAIISIIVAVVCLYIAPTVNNNIRRDRIISILDSLKIDNSKYSLTYESIFGDKRIYEWDSGRSFSSERTYIRGANVDTTVAELKKAISDTDFTFYEEPYPGSADFMYIYKSPKNEYLRVSVGSKTREDAFYNRYSMGLSTEDITISPNAGPSNVTIKVNLDDNNE
jgi:hypothetical protein